MVTNETMAVRTAKNLVGYLNSKGIKCESDFSFAPIEKVLRHCYYVKKVKECGHTDCIHVGLPDAGSFIAVLEDGHLMSGFHVMIQDAIYCIYLEYVDTDFDYDLYDGIHAKLYSDEWGDCGMFIADINKFKDFIDSLTFYPKTDEVDFDIPF